MAREALTQEQIQARVASLSSGGLGTTRVGGAAGSASLAAASRTYVKPLTSAADSLIESLRIEDGIGLGLAEIDVLTRGFRPSDLVVITGFAHSAKTQLVNQMILNNPDKRVLFFSLDDPAEMILAKLVAMHTGIPSEQLEARVRKGEADANEIIRNAAANAFQNLLVVDDVISINAMQVAVQEATDVWGSKPDCVVIDYLEMIPNSGFEAQSTNVKLTANSLKGWAKNAPYPVICLHQGTRSNAKPGEPITLLSMGFSGEQQSTIVIGTRRKRDIADLEPHERRLVEDTVTVHVVKNKRPGGRCTHFEGVDFHMDAPTGVIRPLLQSDHHRAQYPTTAAQHLNGIG